MKIQLHQIVRPALAAALLLVGTTGFRAFAGHHMIGQKNKFFSQPEVKIARGDSIEFVNNDQVTHNVFATTPTFKFNLKKQAPGVSKAVPFTERGTFKVRCAFHPTMKLTVVVE